MNHFKALIIFLLLLFPGMLFTQDSLRIQWENKSLPDTARMWSLLDLNWYHYIFQKQDSSIVLSNELIDFAKKVDDRRFISEGYHYKAIAYQLNELYTIAIDNYFLSIDYLNNDTLKTITIQGNICGLYRELGLYDESMELAENNLALANEIGDNYSIAYNLRNKGIVFKELGQYDKAIDFGFRALEIFKVIEEAHGVASTKVDIGSAYHYKQELDSALKYYHEANKFLLVQPGSSDYEVTALINLANVYKDKFKYTSNIDSINKFKNLALSLNTNGLDTAMKYSYEKSIRQSHFHLYECYETFGDSKNALIEYLIYDSLKNAFNNSEVRKSIIEKENTYQVNLLNTAENKLKEARFKTKQNQILFSSILLVSLILGFFLFRRQKQKRKIEKLSFLKTKADLNAFKYQFSDHFIFNSIGSIQKKMKKSDYESVGMYLEDFAGLVRMVLENSDETEISLENDILMLKKYLKLEGLGAEINYSITMDKSVDQEETMVPPLLLQPFIENSLKHSEDSTTFSKIDISYQIENNELICVVENIGSSEIPKSTISSYKKKSLGIGIVTDRLNIRDERTKSKSKLNIQDKLNSSGQIEGKRVEIKLPMAS